MTNKVLFWSGCVMAFIVLGCAMVYVMHPVRVADSETAPLTDPVMKRGKEVFSKWCSGCHAPNPARQRFGQGLVGQVFAGTYTLEQRYKGAEPAALEQRIDLDPQFIETIVRQGLNVMPRSRKTEISDSDLTAICVYLIRNTRTNPPARCPRQAP
ncbi:MAG: cytochrome c [Sphingobium sp.]